jgi:hypothetical protein
VKTRRSIQVKVSPAGEITVEARGFAGRGCEAATAAIEAALGTPSNRTRKPEFWQRERQQKTRGRNTQQLGGESGGESGEGES